MLKLHPVPYKSPDSLLNKSSTVLLVISALLAIPINNYNYSEDVFRLLYLSSGIPEADENVVLYI